MQEHLYATEHADFEQLCALGFSEDEALRLIHMRDHIIEQIEYREILEERHRLGFIRWLIEHNRLER
jgi:rRNA processing protein Krr1/Pno1